MKLEEREQYIIYRTETSRKSLEAAKLLYENNFISSAVNRLYYSVFYIVNALLVKNEITAKTHTGLKHQFSVKFIKTNKIDKKYGKLLTKLFNLRQKADYDNYFDIEKEAVLSMIKSVENMIDEIEKIIKIN